MVERKPIREVLEQLVLTGVKVETLHESGDLLRDVIGAYDQDPTKEMVHIGPVDGDRLRVSWDSALVATGYKMQNMLPAETPGAMVKFRVGESVNVEVHVEHGTLPGDMNAYTRINLVDLYAKD